MNLLFGDMKGRVTYDDGIYELRFSKVEAKQGSTFYSLSEGFIDLGGADDIHLPFQVHSGRIEDIATILEPLVKKVSWFPKTLKGDVRGRIDLGGKLDTPKLEINSALEGSDWQWMGERARRVKMDVGYDRGVYYARNARMVKTNGDFHGNIEFNTHTDEMKWDLGTTGLTLADIDFVDRLELPAKSKIEISSVGSGKLEHLKSKTEGNFFATEIKGEELEPTHFDLEVGESNLKANLSVFGKSLQSQLKYSLISRQPSNFKMELNQFDFSPALLIVNPKLLDDPELKANVNGKISLDFLSDQFELARGEIELNQYSLQKTGFSLQLVDPILMPVQLGYFNLPSSRFRFKNGELKINGEGRKGDLNLRIEGTTDLAMAELMSSSIQKASGKATTEVQITGPLKDLKVNGDINWTNGNVLMRFLQTPFEEVDGTIHIRQGLIYVESIESYLGDEIFSMNGKIETFADRFPTLDLRATFEDNKVKMAPLDSVQVRGVATIKGEQPPYIIGGNLEIIQALWTKSFGQSAALSTRGERFAPQDRDKQVASNLFNLDLNVNANQGFFIRNEIIDAEFKGKVRLVGPPENPKLLGDGQLIQGKVLFRDRPFVFESVRIDFDDPYHLNPKFNATAVSEVNQYKIRVLAYGRSDSWKAEVSSTPFLPDSDIYSLLASGLTTTDNSRFKNRDRSYLNQGEAASVILHSLDFSKDVQSKTGLQFDVEEAVDTQTATSVFSPQSVGTNVAAPKVVIKRSLGSNVVLSFGSTVGVGSENQKEVSAEYGVTRGMSFLGVWNNTEEEDTRDTRTSYGVDIKFKKKFK